MLCRRARYGDTLRSSMRLVYLLFGLTVLGVALVHNDAVACTRVAPRTLAIDSTLATSDVTPPTAPGTVEATLSRRLGTQCSNGQCIESSCGDTAGLTLTFPVSVDDSGADSIGYKLVAVDGQLPPALHMREPILAPTGSLRLDVAFDDAPTIDTQAQLVAVDAAGNTSAPSAPFGVAFDGCTHAVTGDECVEESDGCTVGARPSNAGTRSSGALAAVGALLVLGCKRRNASRRERPHAR